MWGEKRWLVCACLLLCMLCVQSANSIPNSEWKALKKVGRSLDPKQNYLSSWTEENDCTKFLGVSCTSQNYVSSIVLFHQVNQSDEIQQLLNAENVDFTLTGHLSEDVEKLTNLKTLVISGHNLSGTIPKGIQKLSQLETLVLSNNFISGTLPVEIGLLSQLNILSLGDNPLSGSIPSNYSNLQNLKLLDLRNSNLEGNISLSVSNLTNIETINLEGNNFYGKIPDYFSSFLSLKHLNLAANNFSGRIPGYFSSLVNLEKLDLSYNNFTGSLPSNIGNLKKLSELNLCFNNFTGSFPTSFYSLTSLTLLKLNFNNFTGSLSSEIKNLNKLYYLDLSRNNFSDVIPNEITELTQLTDLLLSNNSFSGQLPLNIGSLVNLRRLIIGSNRFVGQIPYTIGGLTKLDELYLDNNRRNETYGLEGQIPPEISKLVSLRYLDTCGNLLEGQLPDEFNNLTNLIVCRVCANNIHGTPDFSNLNSLVDLDISLNEFNGELPAAPSDLRRLFFSFNSFDVELSSNMFEKYNQLVSFDLSQNMLVSTVVPKRPPSNYLTFFSLANNNINGSIVGQDTISENSNEQAILLSDNPLCYEESNRDNDLFVNFCTTTNVTDTFQTHNVICNSTQCDQHPGQSPSSYFYLYKNKKKCVCHYPIKTTLVLYSPIFTVMKDAQQSFVKNLWPGQLLPEQINITSSVRYISRIVVDLEIFIKNEDEYHLNERTRIANIIKSGERRRLDGNDAGPYLVATFDSNTPIRPPDTKKDSGLSWSQIFGIVIGPLIVVLIAAFAFIYFISRAIPNAIPMGDIELLLLKNHVNSYRIDDIIQATNNFDESNFLGEGGFGKVYKATGPEGQIWAVKRSNATENVKIDDFRKELFTISTTSHKNIVKLMGYCEGNHEKILIYEFMHYGSLRTHLSPKHRKPGVNLILNFAQRVNIALGAAEGLRYLHWFTKPPLLHRDIKTDNILLSEDLEARVSDFGLSTNLNPDGADKDAFLAGTVGYIDPELFHGKNASTKSDVYSFGVVLLELLTGRPPVMISTMEGSDKPIKISLASWAIPLIDAGDVKSLMDPLLGGNYPEDGAGRLANLALKCLERQGIDRPEMSQVTNSIAEIKMNVIDDKNFNLDLNTPFIEANRSALSSDSVSGSGSGIGTSGTVLNSGSSGNKSGSKTDGTNNLSNASMFFSDTIAMSQITPR